MHSSRRFSKALDKPVVRALWIGLAGLPILNAFFVVIVHGANHPFLEEWYATAPIAIAIHDGTFSLGQLFEPVNEHPCVITKAILALHTALSRYDLRVDMLINVLMNILIALGVFGLVRHQNKQLAFWLMAPISIILISHLQAVNWLIAFQNIFIISALCMVIILLLIQLRPVSGQTLILAAIVALIGSFSMGVAPLMWLAPLIALWLRSYRRWWHYAFWMLCTALVFAYFAARIAEPLGTPLSLDQLGLIFHFALAYLGRPLLPSLDLTRATALGIVGVVLFAVNVFLLWYRRPEWLGSWASLGAFSVGTALLTGYARRAFFMDYALYPLEPRYITHSLLFWCALLIIAASNLIAWQGAQGTLRKVQQTLNRLNLSAGIALSLLFAASVNIAVIPGFKEDVACMLEFPATRDLECAIRLGSEPKHALPALVRIDQLAVRGLGAFAGRPTPQVRDQAVIMPLERLPVTTLQGEADFIAWESAEQTYIALKHVTPAQQTWQLWFHHIHVPTYFEAQLYVPLEARGSVTFRVYANMLLSERQLLFEKQVDLSQQPIPIRVSLAPFLNQLGQLRLTLETEGDSTQAIWLAPRLTVELSEAAALAKYYPPQ